MTINCRRCNCICISKSKLIQHLQRKKYCTSTHENIEIQDYINELLIIKNDGKYFCKFCIRNFNDSSNKAKHERICKKNLNKVGLSCDNIVPSNSEASIIIPSEIESLRNEIISMKSVMQKLVKKENININNLIINNNK
jgi:hypothetical protein